MQEIKKQKPDIHHYASLPHMISANQGNLNAQQPFGVYIMCLSLVSTIVLASSKFQVLTTSSLRVKTYTGLSNVQSLGTLHDDALLIRIHLAILVDASHVLVVALFGLDFVREPFL
jgi:hypothetical protein